MHSVSSAFAVAIRKIVAMTTSLDESKLKSLKNVPHARKSNDPVQWMANVSIYPRSYKGSCLFETHQGSIVTLMARFTRYQYQVGTLYRRGKEKPRGRSKTEFGEQRMDLQPRIEHSEG